MPEGASDPDGLAYAMCRLGGDPGGGRAAGALPEAAARMERILDETEFFLRQYEQPGVVTRWRELNLSSGFLTAPLIFWRRRRNLRADTDGSGQRSPIEVLPRPRGSAAETGLLRGGPAAFCQEGRTYSEDAAFQDELCRTLNLVFRADFGELWSGVTAGA